MPLRIVRSADTPKYDTYLSQVPLQMMLSHLQGDRRSRDHQESHSHKTYATDPGNTETNSWSGAATSTPPSRHAVRDRDNDAPQLQQPSQRDSFRQLVVPSIPGVLIDCLSS